ncbi:hypothetical protein [Streptomyces luteireticuli]|uniref:Uncharacterized protein n=1 Tax=Streptomyces luteireticuli TaxID=173858 RepID=A0ABN0Z883_9ACTN
MRFAPAAASVIALGALLGGFATSSATAAPETAQQRTVAFAAVADVTVPQSGDNNGNG